jgi:type VI secretion system protein ImpI
MTLTLRIENLTSLPDGGPLNVSIKGKRGLDIGRDQYLDWTLPDPTRFISGKHCEVRWHDMGYWLHDISTNGTFLYGDDSRLKEPHRLRDGDRFAVGHYIIAVELDDDIPQNEAEAPARNIASSYEELWNPIGEAAPPIDSKELKASRDLRPVKPDFLSWAIDVPTAHTPGASPNQSGSSPWSLGADAVSDESWSKGTPKLPPNDPEPSPLPNPRRPTWESAEPDGPWTGASAPVSAHPGAAAASFPAERTDERGAEAPKREAARGSAGVPAIDPTAADFVQLFARGAGLPSDVFAARDPGEVAEQLGQLMLFVVENMKQLLDARQQAKRLARSSNQTMIEALNNNPLKFAPNAEDAMRIMFGPKTRSYLDARGALAQSFDDVKRHQVKTYAAMQHALRLMLAEFDPATIEAESRGDSGLINIMGSRKARLWDVYVARWQARAQRHQDSMLNAFMDYFAESYDRDGN